MKHQLLLAFYEPLIMSVNYEYIHFVIIELKNSSSSKAHWLELLQTI